MAMKYLRELLVLKNLKGTGKRKINRIISTYRSVSSDGPYGSRGSENGFDLYVREYIKNTGLDLNSSGLSDAGRAADRMLKWLENNKDISAVTCFDEEFPEKLNDLGEDAPSVLYVRTGKGLDDIKRKQIIETGLNGANFSVIGSRWPEDHVLRNAPGMIRKAAETSGRIIISGLARGCDSIGHRAALAAGAGTIAIMAGGPDIITPSMNYDLAMEILENEGLIVTEYDPGTEAREYQYIERDRMLAALSDGVAVLECGMNSGTMKTVEAAAGLERPVGCICDAGGNRLSEGCRYIIEKMGAVKIGDERIFREFLSDIPDASERRYLTAGRNSKQFSIF